MKKMILFGTTPHSRLLRYTMEHDAGIKVDAYCLTTDYMFETHFDELPIVDFYRLNELFGKNNFEVLLSIGYHNMNRNRQQFFNECRERQYSIASFIHPSVKVYSENIGYGNIIMGETTIGPFCQIGNGNYINRSLLSHDSVIGDFNYIASSTVAGLVTIKNNCFLGVNSCVGDQVRIGAFCLIGAGATVIHDLEDCSGVMSPTARIIKSRPEILSRLLK